MTCSTWYLADENSGGVITVQKYIDAAKQGKPWNLPCVSHFSFSVHVPIQDLLQLHVIYSAFAYSPNRYFTRTCAALRIYSTVGLNKRPYALRVWMVRPCCNDLVLLQRAIHRSLVRKHTLVSISATSRRCSPTALATSQPPKSQWVANSNIAPADGVNNVVAHVRVNILYKQPKRTN